MPSPTGFVVKKGSTALRQHVRRHPGSRIRNADDDVVAWLKVFVE